MKYKIKIKKKININDINKITTKNTGATVIFVGTIKNLNNNKKIKNISYYVFKKLFKKIFEKKCKYFLKNKKADKIKIIQINGSIKIKDINSIIIVSSKIRKNAFFVCRELVETLKYKAPVWKKEFYKDNSCEWLNV